MKNQILILTSLLVSLNAFADSPLDHLHDQKIDSAESLFLAAQPATPDQVKNIILPAFDDYAAKTSAPLGQGENCTVMTESIDFNHPDARGILKISASASPMFDNGLGQEFNELDLFIGENKDGPLVLDPSLSFAIDSQHLVVSQNYKATNGKKVISVNAPGVKQVFVFNLGADGKIKNLQGYAWDQVKINPAYANQFFNHEPPYIRNGTSYYYDCVDQKLFPDGQVD